MAILIAYYSRAGENYFGGSYRRIPVGNTRRVAEQLASLTGGDLLELRQAHPYSDDYRACVAQARADWQQSVRPELLGLPKDLSGLSQLLRHHAHGGLYLLGALRLHRQAHLPLLHPRGQRPLPDGAGHPQSRTGGHRSPKIPPPTQNKRAETTRSPLSCHICVKIFVFSIGKYNYMCYYMIVKRKYL